MSFLRVIALVVPLGLGVSAAQAAPGSRLAASSSSAPAVEGFVAERVPRLSPGVALNFSVFGSERAAVVVYVEGVPGLLDLREVQPGVYEGTYVIATGDRLRADSQVVATLQRGGQVVRATLAEPLVMASAPLPWSERRGEPVPMAMPIPIPTTTATSMPMPTPMPVQIETVALEQAQAHAQAAAPGAVVESIRVVEAPAPDDVPGRITRALEDHRSRVLGLLDAIGLPFAGREKQRLAERAMEYEVSLRLPDGTVMARRYGTRPSFQVGDTVALPLARARATADS